MWVDEEVLISDSNPNADYTTDYWGNSYISLKVGVDGKLETMNMPLTIETSDAYVENNNAYFIAKISNFYDINDLGKTLDTTDNIKFQVTGTNSDLVFSYKDSECNVLEETSETLDLTYLFNKNKTVEVQVFVEPKNDANAVTDLNFKLTRNGEVVQNFYKRMNVYGANFCLNNGFTKLYDCILASDSLATDVSTAKANIEAKGEPNLNDTSPSYTYVEDITYDVENVYNATGYQFYFGDSYEFDSTKGTFKLINVDGSGKITDYLSDTYKDYYTCGATRFGHEVCGTIYRVDSTNVEGTTYTITKGDKITYKEASSIKSEVGLYKSEDDYGDSYVFRGDVTNNNVAFGGYYWKILRTNGDNSIRLVYNGASSDAWGWGTMINYSSNYTYSSKYNDPTYVGYMYGKNFGIQTSNGTSYLNFASSTQYYFADGYEFDEENEVFKLKKVNLDPVSGTFTEMKDLFSSYPYTCKATSETASCEVLLKVYHYNSATSVQVQYVSYSSLDLAGTRTNEQSSNAKTLVDNWYSTNIVGKKDDNGNLITDYIVDGTFCNDRGISSGSGYLLNIRTNYASYTRLNASDKTANLKCSTDTKDKFSSTSSKGNGLLEYPVALMTADEVALAGGKSGFKNSDYYLYTNSYSWTMSPAYHHQQYGFPLVWGVRENGTLDSWSPITNKAGLKPVINLRSDVLISSGDGTTENPFVLSLN